MTSSTHWTGRPPTCPSGKGRNSNGGSRILFGAPTAVLLRRNEKYLKTPRPTPPFRKQGMANAAAVSTRVPWLLSPLTPSSGRWELRAFPAHILPPPRQFPFVEKMNTRESLWPLNVVAPYAFLLSGPPPI